MDYSIKITISPPTVNGISGNRSDGDVSMVDTGELNLTSYVLVSWEFFPFKHRILEEHGSLRFADHRQHSQISYIAPGFQQNVGWFHE